MTRAFRLLACLCALALACTSAPTQIILAVDTDMNQGPGRELTHVRVKVLPSGTPTVRYANVFTLDPARDGGLFRLPSTLGIAALDNDGRRTVDIQVTAIRAPTGLLNLELTDTRHDLFTARAIVPFQQEKTLGVGVFLYRDCIGSRCDPGTTCDRGLCVDARRAGVEVNLNVPVDGAALTPPPRDGSPAVPRDDVPGDLAADVMDDREAPMDAAVDVPPAMDVLTCPAGMTECEGACVDLARTLAHCGRCRNACPSPARSTATCANGACGFTCLAGAGDCDSDRTNGCETDLTTAAAHCGACGMACSIQNGSAACAGGACVVAGCNAGFGDCDRAAVNGCETNLGQTAAHCGMCGRACTLAHATALCRAGSCAIGTCDAGFADCDGDPDNGCEVDLRSDANHCGACRQTCARPRATVACVSGACSISACDAGFGDCDRDAQNGCETSTQTSATHCGGCGIACGAGAACSAGACASTCAPGTTNCASSCVNTNSDVNHCGMCGRVCALANAFASCVGGTCGIMTCRSPWDNCDGNVQNGCETDTSSTLAHCGRCGRACNLAHATPRCDMGVCRVAVCDAGYGDCNLDPLDGCETDLRVSPSNCGACGNTCARANATATCAASRCAIGQCNPGFGDCDRVDGNGCETGTSNNLAHCGACGMSCPAPANASAACVGTTCTFRCNIGFGDCDGNAANGCETNTTASATHCGRCGNFCSFPNASAACASGQCALGACNAGFGNCDGNAANGCETSLTSSLDHCGRCGNPCAMGQVCSNGVCVSTCAAGLTLCNGACVNLATDPSHCGTCNSLCSSSSQAIAVCTSGRCGFGCLPGFGDCDGNATNDCETDTLTSVSHCGRCNNPCTFANGTPWCMSGFCTGTCNPGFSNCNLLQSDGCEADTQTDENHCGACNRACPSETSCLGGECRCPAGRTLCGARCVDTNSNANHCGACNVPCPPGASCTGGMCRCPGGLELCNGACVDLASNPAHCGSCNNFCPGVCSFGACNPTDGGLVGDDGAVVPTRDGGRLKTDMDGGMVF